MDEPNQTRARTRRAAIAGVVSLLIVAGAIGLAFLPGDPDATSQPVTTEYAFTSYDSSAELIDAYEGRPMVINFFASWCAPCRAELPDFVDAHAQFGDRVAFVGIDYLDPEPAEAEALLRETGVTYDIAVDPTGAILDDLSGLPAMPTTIFVDADGEVTERHRGIILPAELADQIERLL